MKKIVIVSIAAILVTGIFVSMRFIIGNEMEKGNSDDDSLEMGEYLMKMEEETDKESEKIRSELNLETGNEFIANLEGEATYIVENFDKIDDENIRKK